MIRSLRIRLLVATSLASAAVLALLGVSVYLAMRHQLLSDYDAALLGKARMIASTVEQVDNRVRVEFDPKDMPEFSAPEHPEFFELWLDGKVRLRSESLHGSDLPNTAAAVNDAEGTLSLPRTHHGRAVVMTFTPKLEFEHGSRPAASAVHNCTVTVAGSPVETRRMLAFLGWLLLGSCAAAIALSGAVLLWVVSRAVRPVRLLAKEIERVRESDLGYRLRDRGAPSELSPVVEKLNGLLDRLERAFNREKAFTADVAHELRTPLAGLMSTLEVCRSRRREAVDYEAAIDECCSMTDRMQVMVENLLLLSRADTGHLAVKSERVSVPELLREMWSIFEDRAESRGLEVRWSVDERCDAASDPANLRIVIQNLFDNAVSYTDEDGAIRITSACERDRVTIEIANSGSTVGSSDVSRIFDRFWRGDSSRSDTGVHCGLGMSLSQRLVRLLGGEITVHSTAGGEFSVRVSLPIMEEGQATAARPRLEAATSAG
jgi:heavy metal sensor kinase